MKPRPGNIYLLLYIKEYGYSIHVYRFMCIFKMMGGSIVEGRAMICLNPQFNHTFHVILQDYGGLDKNSPDLTSGWQAMMEWMQ